MVDFIKAFKHTGLALLIKKPYMDNNGPKDITDIQPIVFQVMGPFASEVWALSIVAFLVVSSLILFKEY